MKDALVRETNKIQSTNWGREALDESKMLSKNNISHHLEQVMDHLALQYFLVLQLCLQQWGSVI